MSREFSRTVLLIGREFWRFLRIKVAVLEGGVDLLSLKVWPDADWEVWF